jgi:hypothetical protein
MSAATIDFVADNGTPIGYPVPAGLGVGIVVLDHCRDRTTGALAGWAQRVLMAFRTYSVVAPGGTRVLLYFYWHLQDIHSLGPAAFGGQDWNPTWEGPGPDAPAIEICFIADFFRFTRQKVPGAPDSLRLLERVAELAPIMTIGEELERGNARGAPSASPPPLEFTIARAEGGAVLTKQIKREADGSFAIRDYNNAAWFTFKTASAPDIRTFGRALYRLARDRHAAVLRGAPLPHVVPGSRYRRRARAADGSNALGDCARAWAMIDLDDVIAPEGVDPHDAEAVSAFLQTLLPPELRGVDHILQFSNSAGFTGDDRMLRVHLWFALTAPVSDDDLRRWAMAHNARVGSRVIDFAPFNPAQLHYIANPILAPGITDPVPRRWHFIAGPVAERATIVPPVAGMPILPSGDVLRPGGGFGAWLDRIGSVEQGFNAAIIGAVGAAARAGLSRDLTIPAVRAAVLAANPGHRPPGVIARYASDRFIGSAFDRFVKQDATRRQAEAGKEFTPVADTHRRAWDRYQAEGAASAAMKKKTGPPDGSAGPR